ncbi:hypothetical protein KM043_002249 [Ampulex compressa]|nr:hypothetical protein KM043_002249 [Ampulex compressa]
MRDGTELSGIEKGRGEKRIGDIAGIGRLHCLAAASSSCYATRCQNKGANWKAETACAVPRLFRQGDTSGKTPPPWDYENTGEKISGIVEMRVRVLRPRGQLQNGGARILRKFAVQEERGLPDPPPLCRSGEYRYRLSASQGVDGAIPAINKDPWTGGEERGREKIDEDAGVVSAAIGLACEGPGRKQKELDLLEALDFPRSDTYLLSDTCEPSVRTFFVERGALTV